MAIIIALVLLVSSIAVLYFMYRSLSEDAREWVETFFKMAVVLSSFVVLIMSTYYLVTGSLK
jgi:succinate dehydrogenase hydrophobic anchor subunit